MYHDVNIIACFDLYANIFFLVVYMAFSCYLSFCALAYLRFFQDYCNKIGM